MKIDQKYLEACGQLTTILSEPKSRIGLLPDLVNNCIVGVLVFTLVGDEMGYINHLEKMVRECLVDFQNLTVTRNGDRIFIV